ncbi:MAG: hypothetical protein ABIJ92_04120 [Candidatus Aenigmatarchaeota archaeon]
MEQAPLAIGLVVIAVVSLAYLSFSLQAELDRGNSPAGQLIQPILSPQIQTLNQVDFDTEAPQIYIQPWGVKGVIIVGSEKIQEPYAEIQYSDREPETIILTKLGFEDLTGSGGESVERWVYDGSHIEEDYTILVRVSDLVGNTNIASFEVTEWKPAASKDFEFDISES